VGIRPHTEKLDAVHSSHVSSCQSCTCWRIQLFEQPLHFWRTATITCWSFVRLLELFCKQSLEYHVQHGCTKRKNSSSNGCAWCLQYFSSLRRKIQFFLNWSLQLPYFFISPNSTVLFHSTDSVLHLCVHFQVGSGRVLHRRRRQDCVCWQRWRCSFER